MVRAPSRGEGTKTIYTMADIQSPVSNRQTNMIQARISNVLEVLFNNPLPSMNGRMREARTERSGMRGGRPDINRVIAILKKAGRAYSVPVVLKRAIGVRGRLTESPFVDDAVVAGVVEETRSYPRLTQCKGRQNLPSDGVKRIIAQPKQMQYRRVPSNRREKYIHTSVTKKAARKVFR